VSWSTRRLSSLSTSWVDRVFERFDGGKRISRRSGESRGEVDRVKGRSDGLYQLSSCEVHRGEVKVMMMAIRAGLCWATRIGRHRQQRGTGVRVDACVTKRFLMVVFIELCRVVGGPKTCNR
jgi:hypothetical protein